MNSPAFKILLVDRESGGRVLLEHFFKHTGHTVIPAENVADAIRLFEANAPDMVLLEASLASDGDYEIVSQIKASSRERWTPVLILSDLISPADQVRGLHAGADDYLAKPVNLSVLAYKLQALQRIAAMQNALFETLVVLKQYQDKTEAEIGLARHMMRQLERSAELQQYGVEFFNLSAGAFSGDLVTAAGASGTRYVLLADVVGHGLAAALNAIPLLEAFFELAERAPTLEALCRGINRRLNRILPPGYFIAAAIVAIDDGKRQIQVWNGGLPTAWFVSPGGQIKACWQSRHPALGIFKDHEFDATVESLIWSGPGQILMYTDGLVEAMSAVGEAFGESRLAALVCETPECERLLQIKLRLQEFLSGAMAHDDITLVTVECR